MRKSLAMSLSIVSVMTALCATACSKKGAECKAIITKMNDLGTRLAETQKVTGAADAKPVQVAAALGPFSTASKGVADSLSTVAPTIPELKKIADDASKAVAALSAAASQMTQYAGQMQNVGAAGKAVDDSKSAVDAAEAEIKKSCEASPAKCKELSKVLSAFPSPPQKSEDTKAVAAWTGKLSTWAADLAKVEIMDPTLKQQVQSFDKGWKSFGTAMSQLVSTTDAAGKYDETAKSFNIQIDQANKAIAEANAFCN